MNLSKFKKKSSLVGKKINFQVIEIKSNTFIFTFDGPEDKDRVFSKRPWLFDNHLLVLQVFDGSTQPSKFIFSEKNFGCDYMIFRFPV